VLSLERHGTVDLYTLASTGGALRRVTHAVPDGAQPMVSPDGRSIAFTQPDLNVTDHDVWLMGRDGSGGRQITDTELVDEQLPSFSPEGRLLAWIAGDRIVVAHRDGTHQQALAARNVGEYSWTPAARLSYVAACRVRTVAPDGTEAQTGARLHPCRFAGTVPRDAKWSPDGKLLAWPAGGLRFGGVWVARRDGSDVRRVFFGRRVSTDVVGWLPGGELVYAVRVDLVSGDRPAAARGLFAIRSDGSGLRRLSSRTDIVDASLAQGGRQIAFRASGGLVVMDALGRERRLGDPHVYLAPAWSPDGLRIAFSSGGRPGVSRLDTDLFVIHVDRSGQARLTFGHGDDADPSYSPDGRSLVWARGALLDLPSRGGIVRMRIGSGAVRPLARGRHPHWSPDARRIVFAAGALGVTRPTVMDADGRNAHLLLAKGDVRPYVAGEPSWSPDGRRVAFVIFRRAGPELDVVDADGRNRRAVTQRAAWPVWSPDGREIAFVRGDELWAIELGSNRERRIADVTGIQSPPDWQPRR
jgi:Tol biopolymer transport system component